MRQKRYLLGGGNKWKVQNDVNVLKNVATNRDLLTKKRTPWCGAKRCRWRRSHWSSRRRSSTMSARSRRPCARCRHHLAARRTAGCRRTGQDSQSVTDRTLSLGTASDVLFTIWHNMMGVRSTITILFHNNNKCIGDDTKAAARQSPNCI